MAEGKEEDWTTDILMTWNDVSILLDLEYLDSLDNEAGITILDSQTECRVTRTSEHFHITKYLKVSFSLT